MFRIFRGLKVRVNYCVGSVVVVTTAAVCCARQSQASSHFYPAEYQLPHKAYSDRMRIYSSLRTHSSSVLNSIFGSYERLSNFASTGFFRTVARSVENAEGDHKERIILQSEKRNLPGLSMAANLSLHKSVRASMPLSSIGVSNIAGEGAVSTTLLKSDEKKEIQRSSEISGRIRRAVPSESSVRREDTFSCEQKSLFERRTSRQVPSYLFSQKRVLCAAAPAPPVVANALELNQAEDASDLWQADENSHYFAQFASNNPIEDYGGICQIQHSKDRSPIVMAAVYDGHGGPEVAAYVSQLLPLFIRDCLKKLPAEEVKAIPPTRLLPAKNISLQSLVTIDQTKPIAPLPDLTDNEGQGVGLGSLNPNQLALEIKMAFKHMDEDVLSRLEPLYEQGVSRSVKVGACCTLLLADESRLVVANAGDCKAVLCRGGKALPLTRQQNADSEPERKRLQREHPGEGDVVLCKRRWQERKYGELLSYPLKLMGVATTAERMNGCYVKGRLQPTRSFGDFYLKDAKFSFDTSRNRSFVPLPHSFPYISVEPHVDVYERCAEDEFVVLGTDGVWDFLSDEECVEIISRHINSSAKEAAEQLLQFVLERASAQCGLGVADMIQAKARRRFYDDSTIIIVKLFKNEII